MPLTYARTSVRNTEGNHDLYKRRGHAAAASIDRGLQFHHTRKENVVFEVHLGD